MGYPLLSEPHKASVLLLVFKSRRTVSCALFATVEFCHRSINFIRSRGLSTKVIKQELFKLSKLLRIIHDTFG